MMNRARLVPRPLRRHARAGFTLIEVMVSVALLATAFVSLLSLQRQGVSTHIRMQNITLASMIAEDQLERMILHAQGFDRIPEVNDELSRTYPAFQVEAVLDEVDPNMLPIVALLPAGLTLRRITVRVVWKEGEVARNYQLQHFVTQKLI
jgi:type II secretion system protein I